MKTVFLFLSMMLFSACAAFEDMKVVLHDLGGGPACPAMPDLAPAPPRCAAAKGLTGESLLCVDF
ncbi:MAG TPA: hypothetical protein PKE31_14075, partial [Pseudomonadota bacterium]|nr:hypothetical protein [Pseudomonadota bacterium]